MTNANEIKPAMPVVCSQDGQFASIDHMEGESSIKLKKDAQGVQHYIPLSWVTSTKNGQFKVNRLGDQAMQDWVTNASV